MMTFEDLLRPEHIELNPKASTHAAAIREIAGLLSDSVRVLDADELFEKVKVSAPCILEQDGGFWLAPPSGGRSDLTHQF